MDWADSSSAIDDSYEPIESHSQPNAAQPFRGEPVTLENFGYNGPRSGHWTVKSTVVGSAIDDGCPTIHATLAESLSGAGRVQPVKGNVVERLAKATLLERQEDEKIVKRESVWSAGANQLAAHVQSVPLHARPKGFYVPKNGKYGIRISSKNGKMELMRAPQARPTAVGNTEYPRNSPRLCQNEETAEVQECMPTVKSDRVASAASRAGQQARHTIRIVGKNGEEVFAKLPPKRFTSQSMSPATLQPDCQSPGERSTGHKNSGDNTAQRDAHAAKAGERLRKQRAQQELIDRQRTEEAKVAANALMSGVLSKGSGTPSPEPNASVRSTKSSEKNSGSALGGTFGDTSKPLSVASSNTSIPLSEKAAIVASQHESSQRSLSPQWGMSSFRGWQEVGSGFFDAATPAEQRFGHPESRRPSAAVSGHSSRCKPGVNEGKSVRSGETMKVTSYHSQQRSSYESARGPASGSVSQHSSSAIPKSDEPPTIYAGRGWISPHPLSVAPTEFQAPPDQAIRIPSQKGGPGETTTMTFQEWKGLQQSEDIQATRRNFSRSTSGAGAYIPGSWGHRSAEEGGPVRPQNSQRAYQSPMVESVRSGQTYEHQFEGVREVDGQTYLRMPWDNRHKW